MLIKSGKEMNKNMGNINNMVEYVSYYVAIWIYEKERKNYRPMRQWSISFTTLQLPKKFCQYLKSGRYKCYQYRYFSKLTFWWLFFFFQTNFLNEILTGTMMSKIIRVWSVGVHFLGKSYCVIIHLVTNNVVQLFNHMLSITLPFSVFE